MGGLNNPSSKRVKVFLSEDVNTVVWCVVYQGKAGGLSVASMSSFTPVTDLDGVGSAVGSSNPSTVSSAVGSSNPATASTGDNVVTAPLSTDPVDSPDENRSESHEVCDVHDYTVF